MLFIHLCVYIVASRKDVKPNVLPHIFLIEPTERGVGIVSYCASH